MTFLAAVKYWVFSQSREPFKCGQSVKIWRDETQFPARGAWFGYRGKTGRIADINRDGWTLGGVEFLVDFGDDSAWFKAHELVMTNAKGN